MKNNLEIHLKSFLRRFYLADRFSQSQKIHDQVYEYYSWDRLGREAFKLARQMVDAGVKADRVIALAKGGLTFSRSMVDYLDIPSLSTMEIQFYNGIGTTEKEPKVTQDLPLKIKDENILIFDDVIDKGDTMRLAVEYIKERGAKKVVTAALVSKPWATFKPDFLAIETEAWAIFPNEARETILLLKKMWSEKGDQPAEIERQLLKIGFPKDEVEFFMKIE